MANNQFYYMSQISLNSLLNIIKYIKFSIVVAAEAYRIRFYSVHTDFFTTMFLTTKSCHHVY